VLVCLFGCGVAGFAIMALGAMAEKENLNVKIVPVGKKKKKKKEQRFLMAVIKVTLFFLYFG
jgi:hypothetical protein